MAEHGQRRFGFVHYPGRLLRGGEVTGDRLVAGVGLHLLGRGHGDAVHQQIGPFGLLHYFGAVAGIAGEHHAVAVVVDAIAE